MGMYMHPYYILKYLLFKEHTKKKRTCFPFATGSRKSRMAMDINTAIIGENLIFFHWLASYCFTIYTSTSVCVCVNVWEGGYMNDYWQRSVKTLFINRLEIKLEEDHEIQVIKWNEYLLHELPGQPV